MFDKIMMDLGKSINDIARMTMGVPIMEQRSFTPPQQTPQHQVTPPIPTTQRQQTPESEIKFNEGASITGLTYKRNEQQYQPPPQTEEIKFN